MNNIFRVAVCGFIIASLLLGMRISVHAEAGIPAEHVPVNHVIIIGVDGMSPDGVRAAHTPVLDAMMEAGSWSLNARGVLPTSSSANWASLLTSSGPEQHGVTSNDWRVGEFNFPASIAGSGNFYPSIFQIIRDQKPDWKVGSVYHWQGFNELYDHRFVNYDAHGSTSDETTALAAAYIRAERPQFLFVHLDDTDHVGHAVGHGTPAYYEAVTKADAQIGQIWQAVNDAGIAGETVLVITSDHGGVGKGHGGQTLAELEIPWIAYGKAIKPGRQLNLPVSITDTSATAAWLLGLDIPYAWHGRPIKSVLAGEADPPQAYRLSGLHASPRILPEGEGNNPPGGLFVGKTAVMSMENLNPVGQIRYTLDGSIPSPTSPVYTAPIELASNTIVNATLFIDGGPASIPATAYYRVVAEGDKDTRGVAYSVYLLAKGPVRLPDFSSLKPAVTGKSYEFSLDGVDMPRDHDIAVVFEGFLTIPTAGKYTFSLASDDGSKLYIGGQTVVDNDGDHGVITASGAIDLEPGKHPIRVEYFNGGGGYWLGAYFSGPGIPRQFIDPNLLSGK